MNQSRAMRYVGYSVTAILMIALAVAVLFAACFVSETEKKVAFWSTVAIVAICATPHFRRRLREQCSIFFLLVTAYIILAGASTLYAYAPKFALSEFSRLLAAYAVFLTVFTFAKRETFLNAVAVLCGTTSLLSLLHLDAASAGLIAHDIMRKFQTWTGGYFNDVNGNLTYGYGVTTGRLSGLFGNSNSMATICAIGIFLALYLLLRAKGPRRLLPCAALVINAVTFLMCISIGGTLSLGVTVLLVLLCLHGAYNRMNFLLVTLETLAVAGVAAALSFSHLGYQVADGYLVLVFCVAGWFALFGLDWLLRPRFTTFLCKKIKVLRLSLLALMILMGIGCTVAVTQTADVVLQGSDLLYKRFFPGTGSCEISVEMDGDANVRIASTSQLEILLEDETMLFNGAYEGPMKIEIPQDAIEVQLIVTPVEGATVTVHSISYIGEEESRSISAGYRWIPNGIMQRFQSVSTNHSAMQRIIFMQDGLKMWKQAPLFGRGLGGYENGLASVQNFFYETKYAHNYYVQVLCDLGIVGLILFVSLLGFAIKSLWFLRQRDGSAQALFPALLGAVIMFMIHGGLEISPSVAEVSLVTFGTFGLISHVAPMPTPWKNHRKIIALVGSLFISILAAVYGFFLIQNARAAEIVNQETVTTSQLKKCVQMDVFEGDDYRLTYVVAAMAIQDQEVYQQADIYAAELQAGNSNAVGSYLTKYYLHRCNYDKARASSEKFLVYTRSNVESWNTEFHIFEDAMLNSATTEQMEQIVQIVLDTYNQFRTVQEQQTDHPFLDDRSVSFMTRILSTEGTVEQRLISLLYDSRYAPDINEDGCPDNAITIYGNVEWTENGGVSNVFAENGTVQYQIVSMREGAFALTLETETPEQISATLLDIEPVSVDTTEDGIVLYFNITSDKVGEVLDLRISMQPGVTVQRVSGVQVIS